MLSLRNTHLFFTLTFLFMSSICYGELTWHSVKPYPMTNSINEITYGNGFYVAVGDSGTIITSVDSKKWELQESGTDYKLESIIYANGCFLVIGSRDLQSVVLKSIDGITWENKVIGDGNSHFTSIAYGTDVFAIVGDSGEIYISGTG